MCRRQSAVHRVMCQSSVDAEEHDGFGVGSGTITADQVKADQARAGLPPSKKKKKKECSLLHRKLDTSNMWQMQVTILVETLAKRDMCVHSLNWSIAASGSCARLVYQMNTKNNKKTTCAKRSSPIRMGYLIFNPFSLAHCPYLALLDSWSGSPYLNRPELPATHSPSHALTWHWYGCRICVTVRLPVRSRTLTTWMLQEWVGGVWHRIG